MARRIDYDRIAPDAVKSLYATHTYLTAASIPARMRALIDLRVSQINGCAYCCDMHSQEARRAGESQQRLDVLAAWREAGLFDEKERAALDWAESVTNVARTGVPDAVFEELKRHWSEQEIVDLTLVVAAINAWNRIAISLRQGPPVRTPRPDAKV